MNLTNYCTVSLAVGTVIVNLTTLYLKKNNLEKVTNG